MENQSASISKAAMTFGLYLGLALVLNSVIFYVAAAPFSEVSRYVSYIIIIAGLSLGMWSFGKSTGSEGFPYGKVLGLGVLQSLFASILIAFFTFVLYQFIDPGLIDKLMAFTEEKLLSRGAMNEDQVEAALSMSKKMMTPGIMAFSQVFSLTLMGTIFSLILAIFFKKKPADPFFEVKSDGE